MQNEPGPNESGPNVSGRCGPVSAVATPRQLVFDLPVRQALGRRDYLVADCNSDAVAWLDRWPDWPQFGLVLSGPAASGKTHLASVWDAQSGAAWLDGHEIDRLAANASADPAAVILDDLDDLLDARPDRQETVFHLFNRMRASGGALLATAKTPPARWGLGLRDLSSRLNSLPSVSIGAPDDPLLAALIVKRFGDRQVQVSPEVVDFMLLRIDRSFRGVDRVVAAIDQEALAAARPITVPLARRALDQLAVTD